MSMLKACIIQSLIDAILNSYVVAMDWLNWNTGWWRGRNPDGDKKSGDIFCGIWMPTLIIMLTTREFQIQAQTQTL